MLIADKLVARYRQLGGQIYSACVRALSFISNIGTLNMQSRPRVGGAFTNAIAASLVFICSIGGANGQSVESCPQLPAEAHLKWDYTEGPDFDVCRAMRGASQVFGVYLGNNPSFHPSEKQRAEGGKIGEYEVIWYNVPALEVAYPISKQTLVHLGRGPVASIAHVWLTAINEEDLNQTLAILRQMSFR